MLADAEMIIYHMKEDFIELIGNAHLIQNENSIRGDTIKYDVEAGRVRASSTEGSQIQTTFKSATAED